MELRNDVYTNTTNEAKHGLPAPPELCLSPTKLYRKMALSAKKDTKQGTKIQTSGGKMIGNQSMQIGISASVITVPNERLQCRKPSKAKTIHVQSRMVMTEPETVKRRNRKLAWEKSVSQTRRNAAFVGKLKNTKTPDDMYTSLHRMFRKPKIPNIDVSKGIDFDENKISLIARKTDKINYNLIREGKLSGGNKAPSCKVVQPDSAYNRKYIKLDQNWKPPQQKKKGKVDSKNGNTKKKRKIVGERSAKVHPVDTPTQEQDRRPEKLAKIAAMFCVETPEAAALRRSFESFEMAEQRALTRFDREREQMKRIKALERLDRRGYDEACSKGVHGKKSKNVFARLYRYLKRKCTSAH